MLTNNDYNNRKDDNDLNLLVKRIGIACLMTILAYAGIQFYSVVNGNPLFFSKPTGIIEDRVTYTINARTKEAAPVEIVVTCDFKINADTLDEFSLRQFATEKSYFYQRTLYYPLSGALKDSAYHFTYDQDDALNVFREMVINTVMRNTSHIQLRSFNMEINHSQQVLDWIDAKFIANRNVEVAEAEMYAKKKILDSMTQKE